MLAFLGQFGWQGLLFHASVSMFGQPIAIQAELPLHFLLRGGVIFMDDGTKSARQLLMLCVPVGGNKPGRASTHSDAQLFLLGLDQYCELLFV